MRARVTRDDAVHAPYAPCRLPLRDAVDAAFAERVLRAKMRYAGLYATQDDTRRASFKRR